jgi:hypothetical protein
MQITKLDNNADPAGNLQCWIISLPWSQVIVCRNGAVTLYMAVENLANADATLESGISVSIIMRVLRSTNSA